MFPLVILAGVGLLYWMSTRTIRVIPPMGEMERAEQIQLLMAEQDRMMGLDTNVYGDIGAAQTQNLLAQLDVQRAEFWEATGEIGSSGDFATTLPVDVDDFYGDAAGEI